MAWTRAMPEAERDDFIARVLERYQAVTGVPNRFAFYQLVSQHCPGCDAIRGREGRPAPEVLPGFSCPVSEFFDGL